MDNVAFDSSNLVDRTKFQNLLTIRTVTDMCSELTSVLMSKKVGTFNSALRYDASKLEKLHIFWTVLEVRKWSLATTFHWLPEVQCIEVVVSSCRKFNVLKTDSIITAIDS